ncbi:rod shape-determining protein MreD [Serratia symbiotica str. 'Cinara cedri']|nr:rod shape-determining protein MreD [Serratia symbiotica str. 'Cinara cedri']
MNNYCINERWIILLSFLIALTLDMLPWPEQIYMFRPSWLELILVYWVMILPHRINIGTGLLLGLIMDLILGSTLGIRALLLSIIAYIIAFKDQLFRSITLWQQAVILILLTLLIDIIAFSIEFLVIKSSFRPEILWNSIINGILWPWLCLLMRKIRRPLIV